MPAGSPAFLFPGQGSQSVGMGRALVSIHPLAAEIFRSADAVLGYRLSRICFEGPETELQLTANAQPAILTLSVAAARVLAERGVKPAIVLGHSLGEYSALVVAGAVSFEDAVLAVHRRGVYMQEAVPVGEGAMAALLGIEAAAAEEICDAARAEGLGVVSVANDNAPGQIVIAGGTAAVERAIVLAKDRGARRAMRLPVSAPFHCELMAPARDRLAADLEKLAFRDLAIPLVTNVDAAPIGTGAEARASLVRQVTGRVRWTESIRRLRAMGADRAIECGPGQVLAGLVKRIDPQIRIASCGDPETLDAAATFATGS
ncbi:MAG: ACP S-malonyltransferase [Acidobacteria bacterium]|nr:ACP S-malonyltransferase [Acidobacteriota bacterium]